MPVPTAALSTRAGVSGGQPTDTPTEIAQENLLMRREQCSQATADRLVGSGLTATSPHPAESVYQAATYVQQCVALRNRVQHTRRERERCRAMYISARQRYIHQHADAQRRHRAEHARLQALVADQRARLAKQHAADIATHAAACQQASQAHAVATAHLAMLHEMATGAMSGFKHGLQEIVDGLLTGTVLAMSVRGDETLVVELISHGTCVDLDAASGFEYTLGSLAVRAGMLKMCGGSLMIIDDATDKISANMYETFLQVLRRIAAIIPTVVLVSQIGYLCERLPTVHVVRGATSHVQAGSFRDITTAVADSRNKTVGVVVREIEHYRQVVGGYLCLRCARRAIVKNTAMHTRRYHSHPGASS